MDTFAITTDDGQTLTVPADEVPELNSAFEIWRAAPEHSGLERAAWCNLLERAGEVLEAHNIDDAASDVDVR